MKIVRIIDMLFVRKDSLGDVSVMTATDLDWEEAVSFGSFIGALSGFAAEGPRGMNRGAIAGAAELADGHLFNEDDVFRVTQALPKNMSAGLVVFEHLWSKPLLEGVTRAGGIALANEWLSVERVISRHTSSRSTTPSTDRRGDGLPCWDGICSQIAVEPSLHS